MCSRTSPFIKPCLQQRNSGWPTCLPRDLAQRRNWPLPSRYTNLPFIGSCDCLLVKGFSQSSLLVLFQIPMSPTLCARAYSVRCDQWHDFEVVISSIALLGRFCTPCRRDIPPDRKCWGWMGGNTCGASPIWLPFSTTR